MKKVLGPIRKVRFTKSTLRQASIREKKGPSLGKIQVKLPHQRSPYAMKFEGRSQEETERQQRCARSKAWNLAKNIYKLREKDKATFYSPPKNGYSWLRKKSRRKESLQWIPERVCKRSERKTLTSAEWETMRTSRSLTAVMTAIGEVQTREEAKEKCQTIGLICQSYASWGNSRSAFIGETLRGSWLYLPLDQRSKNHISPKKARELIAIYQTMCHS